MYSANDSIKIKIVTDSSKTEIRKLSDEEQKKLLDNTDYKYDRVGPAPKSVWERFTEWFWRTIEKIFSTKGGKIGFNIFKFILIIAVIVIIIFLLLKNDVRALFYGKSASVQIDFSEFEENIHTINFDVLIDEAISKKDFRKAVRLHFLKLLKELTDNNLIKWQIDKTNNDYSIELANSKYSSQFKELALLYEYIWYGDFQLDESNFKATISKFKDFRIIV
ncbi:MAG: hypothetical protein ACXVPY_08260 [Bacteroidia bacterium]